MTVLLDHIRPATLAHLIAELLVDHADEMATGEYNYHTEAARNAYADLLAAGRRNCGDDEFHALIDIAVDHEFAEEK